MARHRSPRGRRAHRSPSPQAIGPVVLGAVARRSATAPPHRTPLQRGAAVVAITGGAFSLVAAASPMVDAGTAVRPVAGTSLLPAPVEHEQIGPALVPVAPEPDILDAADLVKAVQLAEKETARVAAAQEQARQEQARQERAAADKKATVLASTAKTVVAVSSTSCDLSTSGLGPVKSHVRAAAEFLGCMFGEPNMHGVAGRGGASDHPSGKAVDFMVDRSTGDALADCALRNKEALGITYVIWRQRINTGSGWRAMEDRGGDTANHMDHVHVSFGSGAGSGGPRGC